MLFQDAAIHGDQKKKMGDIIGNITSKHYPQASEQASKVARTDRGENTTRAPYFTGGKRRGKNKRIQM